MLDYSIVIPAYNEADKISATLTQVVAFMRGYVQKFEVIVVDDGSKDRTAEIVKEYQKSNPEMVLIENAHKGKGYAVYSGVMKAEGELIYLADADLSSPMTELKKLTVWVKEQGFDVVIASREGTGARRIGEPWYRHLMGRVFNLWVRLIALPGVSDSQCGFKLFRGEAAKNIFSKLKIYGEEVRELKKPYMGAFDVEVLYVAKKLGYKMKEVPVSWTYVKTTRLSPFADSLKMAKDVAKVRINDLRGVYR